MIWPYLQLLSTQPHTHTGAHKPLSWESLNRHMLAGWAGSSSRALCRARVERMRRGRRSRTRRAGAAAAGHAASGLQPRHGPAAQPSSVCNVMVPSAADRPSAGKQDGFAHCVCLLISDPEKINPLESKLSNTKIYFFTH